MKFKPYQVGENDIVISLTKDSAREFLSEYIGTDKEDLHDVKDLSDELGTALYDEDGEFLGTLGSLLRAESEEEERYLFGWE